MSQEPAAKKPPRDRRIVKHVMALQEAGQDTKAFVEALAAIKSDANLNDAQRGAIYKTLAQNMALTYAAILSPKALGKDQPNSK